MCLLSRRKYPNEKLIIATFVCNICILDDVMFDAVKNKYCIATSVNGNKDDMHSTSQKWMCFLQVKLCFVSFSNCSSMPSIHLQQQQKNTYIYIFYFRYKSRDFVFLCCIFENGKVVARKFCLRQCNTHENFFLSLYWHSQSDRWKTLLHFTT